MQKNATIAETLGEHTSDLRKFFWACVRDVEKIETPSIKLFKKQNNFILEINNTSWTGSSGTAWYRYYYGQQKIKLRLPKHWEDLYAISNNDMQDEFKTRLARLIIHEYYHILGYNRYDRHNYKYDTTKKWKVEHIINTQIRLKTPIERPKKDLKAERYNKAKDNLKRAETRYKRAKTLHKKRSEGRV